MTKPVVNVVATDGTGLAGAIRRALGSDFRVQGWGVEPPARAVRGSVALVIIAGHLRAEAESVAVAVAASIPTVLVVTDGARVPADWLVLAKNPAVSVVRLGGGLGEGFAPVVSTLYDRLGLLACEELARAVCERCGWGAALASLALAVCRDPWRVRHPGDLAVEAGIRYERLRRACLGAGFARVEHFITCVRAVSYRVLVVKGVATTAAMSRTGIADLSNMRRQLDRARRGTGSALRDVMSLHSILFFLLIPPLANCGGEPPRAEAGVSESDATVSDSAIALPVVGALVRRGDLVLTVRTTGQVKAERQVTLRAETQGTVAQVLVRPGDWVDAGRALVRLDPRPFELAVREAEARVADAQVRLIDALVGDNPADTSAQAATRRENARLRSGVIGAQAQLDRARLDLERAVMQAPFSGTVDRLDVVVGQRVAPGELVARLVDLGSLMVEAAVLEHDLVSIRPGATAQVRASSAPERAFTGRVTAVLPVVDSATHAGRALVRVPTGDGALRPGMYADVELEAARLMGQIIVPAGAVIERDGRPLVFRYRQGRAEWMYVTPGRSNGRETAVLADSSTGRPAVAPGDTVLVEGHLTLTHDAPVRLLRRRP